MAEEKLGFLEGLRGIAALLVVISHWFYLFLPEFNKIAPMPIRIGSIVLDLSLIFTPLTFMLIHNPTSVPIFFALSGYVLSFKFFKTHDKDRKRDVYLGGTIKRYPRLMVPSLGSILLVFIFLHFGLFYNGEVGAITIGSSFVNERNITPNIINVLQQGLWNAYFVSHGNASLVSYNGVLWTMYYEFTGSLLIFSILAFFGEFKYRRYLYIPILLFFMGTHYMGFIFGLMLADFFNNPNGNEFKINNFLQTACAIIIFLLIGLDTIKWNGFKLGNSDIIYIYFAVFLFMVILLSQKPLQWVLSLKPFLFLGKISFSMYLLHTLVRDSLSSISYILLYPKIPHLLNATLNFIITIVGVFIISYIYYIWIDQWSVEKAKALYKWLKMEILQHSTRSLKFKLPIFKKII